VVPYRDVERVVSELKAKGATIEFVLLEGITHYETEGFVQPLRRAVARMQKAWEGRVPEEKP
jgi:hypothetical protein